MSSNAWRAARLPSLLLIVGLAAGCDDSGSAPADEGDGQESGEGEGEPGAPDGGQGEGEGEGEGLPDQPDGGAGEGEGAPGDDEGGEGEGEADGGEGEPALPAACEGLEEQVPGPSIVLDGVAFQYDRLLLNDDRDAVRRINVMFTNTTEEEKGVRYDLKYSLWDADDAQVDLVDSAGHIGENDFIGAAIDEQLVSFGGVAAPGVYVLKTDLYHPDTNELLDTLAKSLCIAPGLPAEVSPVRAVEEVPLSDSVVIDEVEFRFDELKLTDSRDSVRRVNVQFTNTSDEERSFRYDLKYSLYDDQGRLVDVVNSQGHIGENDFIGAAIDEQLLSFSYEMPTGAYVIRVDLYAQAFNIVQATLAREIQLGPVVDAIIVPDREVVELPLASEVTLDDVRFRFDRVTLKDDRTAVREVNLLFQNTADDDKTVRYDLKYSLYDQERHLLDVVDSQGHIGENAFIGGALDEQLLSFHYEPPPGTYVLRVDLYGQAFNIVEATLAMEVELGPGGDASIDPEREVEELALADSVVIDGVRLSFDKVVLDNGHTQVRGVDIAFENTSGQEKDFRHDLKYSLYDEERHLLDVVNSQGHIGENNFIGGAVDEQLVSFAYDQSPGMYLLRVDIYGPAFNVIQGTLAKEIGLGPAAPDEQ